MRALLPVVFLIACADPPPRAPRTQEMVPANSLDEAKLHGAESPSVLDDAPAVAAGPPASSAPRAPARNEGPRAACDRAMDRYLELEIASNPQLRGLPPEVVQQAKQSAREQHGEAPCTGTPAQYRCAIGATSTGAWQTCMK